MAKKKLKVGVLFGGKSAEHEVSLVSAKNVIAALSKAKYQIVPIKIAKDGKFNFARLKGLDVVFPVLHGPFGEDGSMQGVLKLAGIPFVGPGVLGSAVSMDKDVMKRLLRDAGLPVGNFLVFKAQERVEWSRVKNHLGAPVFVKPANLGSSVGISKVATEDGFEKALTEAFKYDTKVIIEENIEGREIECAVLGNEDPETSVLGEIISIGEFYSYDAKYVSDSKTLVDVKLGRHLEDKIRSMAIEVFKALNCEGMGRVDFFLKKDGEVLVNEINTIPGFTGISMYPKLWEASGLSQPKLLDKLISLALARHKRDGKLRSTK